MPEPAVAPPAPAVTRKIHKPIGSGGSPKLPSLNDIAAGKFTAQQENSTPQLAEENANELLPATEFSQEEFHRHWQEYIQLIAQQNKISFHTLLSSLKPVFKESIRFEIEVVNKVQADMLSSEKTELIGHIRSRLNNFSIDFDIVINQTEESHRPYTTTEKYNALAKKNPNLAELKNRLDLETGF